MDNADARQALASIGPRYARRRNFDGRPLISVVVARTARLDRCTFVNADLRQATLEGAHFKMCDFRGAQLRGASLRGAWFVGCDFREADLRDTDMTGAHFGYVNTGNDRNGRTDLSGATITGAVTEGATTEQVIGWPGDD